jgi:ribosomal protein S18 acetylase RimI-like enzyme
MAAIRDASEDDWELLREIRLSALSGAPCAFMSTYVREEGYEEQGWREWLRRDLWLLAVAGESPVQLAGVIAATREPMAPSGEPFISSLWVDPHHRGRGIAKELIQAVIERLVARGATAVSLWVLDGNEAAHRLYAAVGFIDTDEGQDVPGRTKGPKNLREWRMSKSLL